MKILYILLLCLCAWHFARAQNPYFVKGTVTDTASNAKLHNASISILNAKDSTLYRYARADVQGGFKLDNLRKGKFILLLTYPNYADFVYPFTLDSANAVADLKNIDMKSKERLLKEVVVKGRAAITIKGDTTEFNASSYTIQPNDKVEDLLKKLPGIQVDKDGKITAQGKTVPKVLVDGEEFFGDDPTLVTKNLRADMVDKVQLFDKASDQAAFTGVDDGNKTTTINIKLKENAKKGFFGKIDGGYGTKDFYQAQGLFNWFRGKEKFSVYGTMANNGKTGLSWDDSNRLGTMGDMQTSDDGYMFSIGGFDELNYNNQGIPRAITGGAHYDNKWNGDKESINTNYKLGSLGIKTIKNTITQNNLPGGLINTTQNENDDNNVFRQKLDATYSIKLDTTSNLKVSIDGTLKNSDNASNSNSTALRGDNTNLNKNEQRNNSEGKQQTFNISAFYTKKLKKQGRNYSVNVSQNINQGSTDGYLFSDLTVYDEAGQVDNSKRELIDQIKTSDTKSAVFNSNITYNEPITKAAVLVLNYGFGVNDSRSDRKSLNQSAPGVYDVLDTEFSNDFKATQYTNKGGVVFNYNKLKTTISFGTKISAVTFNQTEQLSNQSYNRSFVNWLPQARFQYKFSAQKSFSVGYNGNTSQPSISQLQPVRVNDNPLYQPEGNPDLAPAFTSNININYNSYKILTNQYVYFYGSLGFTNNAIVSNTATDATGKTIAKSVNLTEKTPVNYYLDGSIGKKVKFLFDASVSLNLNANGNTSYNYVKSQFSGVEELNEIVSTRITPMIGISRYKEKANFYIRFGPSYNAQVASLQRDRANKGWGTNGYGGFDFNLLKKIKLRSDAEYTYTPSSDVFATSFEQFIVNASITKSFFKKDDLKLSLSVNDLFNQNRGFNRFANANMITQTSYNNIARYFMFSLVWDFAHMGAKTQTK